MALKGLMFNCFGCFVNGSSVFYLGNKCCHFRSQRLTTYGLLQPVEELPVERLQPRIRFRLRSDAFYAGYVIFNQHEGRLLGVQGLQGLLLERQRDAE